MLQKFTVKFKYECLATQFATRVKLPHIGRIGFTNLRIYNKYL